MSNIINPDKKDGVYFEEERLTQSHSIDDFDCEDPKINEFLKKDAIRYQRFNLAQTYVLIFRNDLVNERSIAGYYTLSAFGIKLPEEMEEQFRREEKYHKLQPAVLIGMLGRHKKHQGSRLGEDLVKLAIKRIIDLCKDIGIRFVVVHAHKKDHVVKMYNNVGFETIDDKGRDDTQTMILDLYQPD